MHVRNRLRPAIVGNREIGVISEEILLNSQLYRPFWAVFPMSKTVLGIYPPPFRIASGYYRRMEVNKIFLRKNLMNAVGEGSSL